MAKMGLAWVSARSSAYVMAVSLVICGNPSTRRRCGSEFFAWSWCSFLLITLHVKPSNCFQNSFSILFCSVWLSSLWHLLSSKEKNIKVGNLGRGGLERWRGYWKVWREEKQWPWYIYCMREESGFNEKINSTFFKWKGKDKGKNNEQRGTKQWIKGNHGFDRYSSHSEGERMTMREEFMTSPFQGPI